MKPLAFKRAGNEKITKMRMVKCMYELIVITAKLKWNQTHLQEQKQTKKHQRV